MAEERTDGEHRVLAVGDRITARPCVVTIGQFVAHGAQAHGYCSTCDSLHIIDRPRYERGDGPWHPMANARSSDDG